MAQATASDWKCEPFTDGVAIPYARRFTPSEFEAIREGFIPGEMQDKWFIHFAEPYLFLHRSWSGKPAYRVEFGILPDGAKVREALWNTALNVDRDPAYLADLLDSVIENFLLHPFQPPPES